jgi:multidrug efflux pump subunit AcrB
MLLGPERRVNERRVTPRPRQGPAGRKRVGIGRHGRRQGQPVIFCPDLAPPQVHVRTISPGASADAVAEAQALGTSQYAMRIRVDPERMKRLVLTVADVNAAVRKHNRIVAAGTRGQEPAAPDPIFTFNVIGEGRLSKAGDFGGTVLRTGTEGRVIRPCDVTRMEPGQSG